MRAESQIAGAAAPASRRYAVGVVADVALVLLALALSGWLTINVWHTGDFDVFEYQQYASAFWLGSPRFSAFPTEYPPLALLPFSVTLLPGFADPRVSFALGMSAVFLAGYAGVWRGWGRSAARRYAWFLLLGLQSTLLARYDLVPALVTLAAVLAARRHRFPLAYALLAVGILLKLYPLVLLPALMIEHWRATKRADSVDGSSRLRTGRAYAWGHVRPALAGGTLCVALSAAGFLLPALRNPAGAFSFLAYATNRPVQVESFAATLLWLASFAGVPLTHTYAFGADAYTSPLAGSVTAGLMVATLLGCTAVYGLQLAGRMRVERATLVCVGLVLLGSKVFSTQYVTWALPLAAAAGGDALLWAAISLLTFADYPGVYPFNQPKYTATDVLLFMAVLAARNLLLLLALGRAALSKVIRARKRAGAAEQPAVPVAESVAVLP